MEHRHYIYGKITVYDKIGRHPFRLTTKYFRRYWSADFARINGESR